MMIHQSSLPYRIGSIISPTPGLSLTLKRRQVPWSVNCVALSFLSEVVRDEEYLEEMWVGNKEWGVEMRRAISTLFPHWTVHSSQPFLSWLWVEVGDEEEAARVVELAQQGGVPVRWGKFGYNLPSFIRLAVRPPHLTYHLFQALLPLSSPHKGRGESWEWCIEEGGSLGSGLEGEEG